MGGMDGGSLMGWDYMVMYCEYWNRNCYSAIILAPPPSRQVCLKMRTLIPGVPPPIIMISGKASTKDVIKGLQAGSCDYITKPFQPQEVLARVETQLRLYMGEVQQLQETAERNMALLTQVRQQGTVL